MQIHVQIQNNGHVEIAIFSKSKRNSTQDRLNTHSYVSLTSDLIVADEVVSFTPRSTSLSTRIYLLIPS
jgi:DNA ligase-4